MEEGYQVSEKTKNYIPESFMNAYFPKCIGCGERCLYMGGVSHPEVAICGKCAEEELERRMEGRMEIWEPPEMTLDEIITWLARRPFVRTGNNPANWCLVSPSEYKQLRDGEPLPESRMRDLRAFIDGYNYAK